MRGGAEGSDARPPTRLSPRNLAMSSLRATASLNRVLSSARTHTTRRSSLFGSPFLSRTSSTASSPKGPESFDGDCDSSTPSSPKRMSFSSVRGLKRDKNASKNSSKHSSPLSRNAKDLDGAVRTSGGTQQSDTSPKASLPIAIAKHSPPPSIVFDFHQSGLVDSQLMEAVGLSRADFDAAMNSSPEEQPSTQPMKSYDLADAAKPRHLVYLPSRNTTDHWRTSKARLGQHTVTEMSTEQHGLRSTSSKTASILNLDRLLTTNEFEFLQSEASNCDDLASAEYEVSPLDAALDASCHSFEKARAKVSARGRQASGESSTFHTHSAELSHILNPRSASSRSKDKLSISAARSPSAGQTNPCGGCRTPSPDKALELPLRPKLPVQDKPSWRQEIKECSTEAPRHESQRYHPSTHSVLPGQKFSLGPKRKRQVSEESADELSSPLLTQDLFSSDSDEENGSYALKLNDLVEKATRDRAGAGKAKTRVIVMEAEVSHEAATKRLPSFNAALSSLSDLKRLRPYREQCYRQTLPFVESRKYSQNMLERMELEREAIDAVFQAEAVDSCVIDDTSPPEDGSGSLIPIQDTWSQDKQLERQVFEMFFNGSKNEDQTDQEEKVDSPLSPSSDSACFIPICRVCGGADNHICEVLSPSQLTSQSPTCPPFREEQRTSKMIYEGPVHSQEVAQGEQTSPQASPIHRRATAIASTRLSKDVASSLGRKKSDPVGLELHRLGNQAAGWLQSLSPGRRNRVTLNEVPDTNDTDMSRMHWKWPTHGSQTHECTPNGTQVNKAVDQTEVESRLRWNGGVEAVTFEDDKGMENWSLGL
ncbi:hypothetical protein BDV97DRAFT_193470 [Delphinella strobiligena]|nr:hypothetical protein BDV97DRAFT_193470 [Delphinella strobiligena]